MAGTGYRKIGDYGIIGNMRSVALVGSDGSIDWLCLPCIDSPSVFGALLDCGRGGCFSLSPTGEWDSAAEYLAKTNVLRTRFRTRQGVAELVDFMPIPPPCRDGRESGTEELYRRVAVTAGRVDMEMTFDPRFDYARSATVLRRGGRTVAARGGGETMVLAASREIPAAKAEGIASWQLEEGQTLWFRLVYGDDGEVACDPAAAEEALSRTEHFWRSWLERKETGRSVHLGHYQEMIDRSALVLKLLQFEETGPIAAAATTSLPEVVGGVRNWDYRYTWVRDTSFTLQALFNLGHLTETEAYLQWIEKLLDLQGAEHLQIMYGLRGEEELPERVLDHLEGYKGSRPVRIGNGAARQKQLDIYGELMDAALRLSGYVGKIDYRLWPVLRDLCDYVEQHWRDRDSGIWEVRGGPYSFVYSKVMCWAALDRGLAIAGRYGFPADLGRWTAAAEEIRREVLEKGWSEKKRSFVQHYDTDALDASSLLLPALGFLPFDDPRILSTIEAVERELGEKGFLHRYIGDDGLPGEEGTFLICSFWLVDCLVGTGRTADAELLLRRLEATANGLGLFAEEYDPRWREALGNFPQAFTHIGYINSVVNLLEAKEEAGRTGKGEPPRPHRFPPFGAGIVLNDGEEGDPLPPMEAAARLKNVMNVLRGAFFDSARSRVAYERMKGSDAYAEYLALSRRLGGMDLEKLEGRAERLTFWINLYNVIVIHAVIELGIRDSVKEVRSFFRRVSYRVGSHLFTPYDIEHGILRGNRRPPYRLTPVFGSDDPRAAFRAEPFDARIHFALVCASSSCPPIDVYTVDGLDKELDLSGRTFLNAGGVKVDRENKAVLLSRIFKWYGGDFGGSASERLGFIAPYLYREEDRRLLEEESRSLSIRYQEYDWRLNRG